MNPWDQFLSLAQSIDLTSSEKTDIRKILIDTIGSVSTVGSSAWYVKWLRPFPAFAVAAAVVLLFGIGTGVAAEGSVPGEFLYSYKLSVNESARFATSLTGTARQRYALGQVERRIEELEILSQRNGLNDETVQIAGPKLLASLSDIQVRIEELQDDGQIATAAFLQARLAASLKIHRDILSITAKQSKETATVQMAVESQSSHFADSIAVSIEKIATKPEAVQKEVGYTIFTSVQQSLLDVEQLLQKKRNKLTLDGIGEIQGRIDHASITIEEGRQQLNKNKPSEAITSLQTAEGLLEEARVLIKAGVRLKIDPAIFPAPTSDKRAVAPPATNANTPVNAAPKNTNTPNNKNTSPIINTNVSNPAVNTNAHSNRNANANQNTNGSVPVNVNIPNVNTSFNTNSNVNLPVRLP